jgi:L-lactate utilization protein LutB
MNEFAFEVIEQRIKRTADALEKNNFEVFVVNDRKEARAQVESLLCEGDTIGVGGSETLNECDILSLVRENEYQFIDRYESGLSKSEIAARHVESLGARVYITSSNAITENGELYNVDGNGNRVAAIAFGPKNVIVIAGYNKIVKDLDTAVRRVKEIAAPANTKRLSLPSYCSEAGECMALAQGKCGMTYGCSSAGRICCDYLVSAYQRRKGRIKVILVKEQLGF